MADPDRGRPLAIDPSAVSADPSAPAFVSRPEGAPAYHGFVLLEDVEVDGFVLGKISDFEAEEMEYGDAFIVAPDGRRAGLIWEVGPARVEQVIEPDQFRWGVWGVSFPNEMHSRADARLNLAEIVPLLRPHWEATR